MTDNLTELESRLLNEPLVASVTPTLTRTGTASAAAIEAYELESGLRVFVKRGDRMSLEGVRNEVAAFRVAKLLGWSALLPVTVLRILPHEDGHEVEAAVAEFIANDFVPPIDTFTQAEINQAGVFDAIVQNTDRSNNNWMVDVSDGSLKLIDHERAFGFGDSVSSTFWDEVGRVLPQELVAAVEELVDVAPTDPVLHDLLGPPEVERIVERASRLLLDR